MEVVWSWQAKAALRQAYAFISLDSIKNAEKVVGDLIYHADRLAVYPEFYPPDKYKTNNDGSWRAFEIHRYRLSYRITGEQVRILRLRHTSMSPLNY